MTNLRMFLPDHMTREHEKYVDAISAQFVARNWPKNLIVEFWQTPMKQINGFCPLEALCADKFELAQGAADYMLKKFDDAVYDIEAAAHQEQRRIKDAWSNDDSLVDVTMDDIE